MKIDVMRYMNKCSICKASEAFSKTQPGYMGSDKKISFPLQLLLADIVGPFLSSNKGNITLLVVAD